MQFSAVSAMAVAFLATATVALPAEGAPASPPNLSKRGPFYPICAAACTPLIPFPPAWAACMAGCAATAQDGGDIGALKIHEDGSVTFEK
ncbi:hypothetical protein CcaCcLH18_13095 [Colletotrichum camelliae]|nr:hypothetical protein CcaCcLH18_13095 [Colletotrichum camelliae]